MPHTSEKLMIMGSIMGLILIAALLPGAW